MKRISLREHKDSTTSLYHLKKFLTLEAAAKTLTLAFSEEVSIADVLYLGLQGHLRLSINLFNHVIVCAGKVIRLPQDFSFEEDAKSSKSILSWSDIDIVLNPKTGKMLCVSTQISEHNWVTFNSEVKFSIAGVWDLPLIGGERITVERLYQSLLGNAVEERISLDGTYLISPDDTLALAVYEELEPCDPETGLYEKGNDGKFRRDKEGKFVPIKRSYYPIGSLPDDAHIVVRPEALDAFKATLKKEPKPPNTKERNTMLAIIAALCKEAKIDYKKPAKSADLIVSAAAEIGLSISQRTVQNYLNEIPNAVESRMK